MAQGEPLRKFEPIRFGGVLNEADSPSAVGGHGLTRAQNVLYRRFGSWGVRPGSDLVYAASATGPLSGQPATGVRWYRDVPSILTQTVVVAQGALYTGGDPNAVTPSALTQQFTWDAQTAPARFAAVNDPYRSGHDVLLITGLSKNNSSFAYGSCDFAGQPTAGQVVTLTVTGTGGPQTVTYTTLGTDDPYSVAQQLVTLWLAAFTPNTNNLSAPIAQQSTQTPVPEATWTIAGFPAGAAGNTNTIACTVSGSGLSVLVLPFVDGGVLPYAGPWCWNGTDCTPFSPWITQAFTGVVNWHEHCWYWGDPQNPDNLYASDINQPEMFTFMEQFGPYTIAPGDGDPAVRAVVPIGNILYVFKTQSIYAITGYDFQSGEYQFSVQPAIRGHGVVTQEAVATLRNALVFFDRTSFYRLPVGAFDVENIGAPIPLTCGTAANQSQFDARAVGGSFLVQTALNDVYTGTGAVAQYLLNNVALFAWGSLVLLYDDEASAREQQYAWSVITGWSVAGWIPFGTGENAAQTKASEFPVLCWLPNPTTHNPTINQFGSNPSLDSGAGIAWAAQTGWIAGVSISAASAVIKNLDQILLETDATAGVTIGCKIISTPMITTAFTSQPTPTPQTVTFPATVAPTNDEAHQTLLGFTQPYLISPAYMLSFTNAGGIANTGFELSQATVSFIEEPFKP